MMGWLPAESFCGKGQPYRPKLSILSHIETTGGRNEVEFKKRGQHTKSR